MSPSPTVHVVLNRTDTIIQLALVSESTGADILNATVEVTLRDAEDVDIVASPPISWPLPLLPVVGFDGTYAALLPYTTVLSVGSVGHAFVVTDGPTVGLHREWLLPCLFDVGDE